MSTTNFEEWLKSIDTDIENIYNLYECITSKMDIGGYNYSQNGERIFIKDAMSEETLVLASEQAERTFLNMLDNRYGGDLNSVDSQYHYNRQMQKED